MPEIVYKNACRYMQDEAFLYAGSAQDSQGLAYLGEAAEHLQTGQGNLSCHFGLVVCQQYVQVIHVVAATCAPGQTHSSMVYFPGLGLDDAQFSRLQIAVTSNVLAGL